MQVRSNFPLGNITTHKTGTEESPFSVAIGTELKTEEAFLNIL